MKMISTAYAMGGNQGAPGAQGAGGFGDWSFIIMMVVIFGIFYFLMIRTAAKKTKRTQSHVGQPRLRRYGHDQRRGFTARSRDWPTRLSRWKLPTKSALKSREAPSALFFKSQALQLRLRPQSHSKERGASCSKI